MFIGSGKIISATPLKGWLPYFVILILVLLVYFQTLFFQYTNLDDSLLASGSEIFSSFRNIGFIFSSDAFFSASNLYYRPLLNLTYLLDVHLGGYAVYFFHFTNVIFHFFAAALVYFSLQQLLDGKRLALCLTLFFAVQPALAQAVAWIPGRNDTLLAIFVLAAFAGLRAYGRNRSWTALGAYLGFFCLALLTKEIAIFLPIIVAVYWLTIGKGDELPAENKWFVSLASLAVIVTWLMMRSLALDGGASLRYAAVFGGLPSSLLMAIKVSYLSIFPAGLSVMHVFSDTRWLYSLLVWPIVIAALLLSGRRRSSHVWFGFTWFAAFFIFPFIVSADAFFSHRFYLPLFGLLIVLGEIDWIKDLERKRINMAVGTIVLIFCAVLTFSHSRNFRAVLPFALAAAEGSPHSWMAQANLGVAYLDSGDYDRAVLTLQRAILLEPSARFAHYNLGLAYYRLDQLAEAGEEWRRELEVNPGNEKALTGLKLLEEK